MSMRRIAGRALGVLMAALATTHVFSANLTCSTTDPAGDTALFGPGPAGEPYEDMVGAAISREGGVFRFAMDLVSAPPEEALLPNGVTQIHWVWGIDTVPEFFPRGYPFAPGNQRHTELNVQVLWDGMGFKAELIDARPQLTGGAQVVVPVPFKIKGSRITVFVDAALMEAPPSFGAATVRWAQLGTDSLFIMDNAPDMPPMGCPEL